MKRILTLICAVLMLMGFFVPGAFAADAYDGKTVVVFTGDIKGDVDVYAQAAAVKDYYTSRGAAVLLVDIGNYLQGKAVANADRGLTVYNLMDAAGYDVAAMGEREFFYGDATTGQLWHANYYRYYTQKALLRGAEELTYNVNGSGSIQATRPAKAAAKVNVVASNISVDDGAVEFYDFDVNKTYDLNGVSVGVYALTDVSVPEKLQDGFTKGLSFTAAADANTAQLTALKDAAITVCLNNSGVVVTGATLNLDKDSLGANKIGVRVIDNATKAVATEDLPDVTPKTTVKAIADEAKATAIPVATSDVILNGADRDNWNKETNLGDLVTDALKWYAENKFDGFAKDVPVVAIQNGGNCDQFIYDGDVTKTDILRALPFSPMGVGLIYLKGSDLLTLLEAATSPSERYGSDACPGFAQVAGMEYEVHIYNEYKAGEAYGYFFKPTEISRVVIKSVNGEDFDEDATYALIADNYLMNGNDTYFRLKELREDVDVKYTNNGNGVLTRDIVEKYITEVLKGKIDTTYATPQGRITVYTEKPEDPPTPGPEPEPQPYVNPFKDVNEKAWYGPAVQFAVENKLFNGITATTFEPNTTMNRAMFVTVLYRMAGSPEASSYPNPFKDVPDGKWYTDAVCWGAVNDIVKGTSADAFSPNVPVTREQAAVLLKRYAEVQKYDTTATASLTVFRDAASVSSWARDGMSWAVGMKFIQGITQDTLVPQGESTRAQIAMILMRFCTSYPMK